MKKIIAYFLLLIFVFASPGFSENKTMEELDSLPTIAPASDLLLIRDVSAHTTNKIAVNNILGAINVNAWGGLAAAVSAIGSTEMAVCVTDAQTLTDDLATPSTLTVKIVHGGSIDGAYTLTINGPFEGCPGCFGATVKAVFNGGSVPFINPRWYYGDLSTQIATILTNQEDRNGDPLHIKIPSLSGDDFYEWSAKVTINRDGHFTLEGGKANIRATTTLTTMLEIGTTNKFNNGTIRELNFDCGDSAVTQAILLASSSRSVFEDINFRNDAGSFTYGIKIDPTVHTGDDGASGFVGCRFVDISPGGDGAVDTAVIYSTGGQTSTTMENIRAVDACDGVKVYLASGQSFSSNIIKGVYGDAGTASLVDLDTGAGDSIAENIINGVTGSGTYGVKIKQRGTATVRDNIILGLKPTDWVTQALYVEDAAAAETYKDTYIYRNFWNLGPSSDAGFPVEVQDYVTAAWGIYNGNGLATWRGEETDGLSIWDSTNGTTWQYQQGAWEADVIKIQLIMADDRAYRIPIPTRIQGGFVANLAGKAADDSITAIIVGRAETTAHCTSIHSGADIELATGALLGTTGTDGKVVISCHTDGYLYIENRKGATVTMNISISQ